MATSIKHMQHPMLAAGSVSGNLSVSARSSMSRLHHHRRPRRVALVYLAPLSMELTPDDPVWCALTQDAFPSNGSTDASTSLSFPGASLRRILTGAIAGEDRFASSGDSGSAVSEKTHKARALALHGLR